MIRDKIKTFCLQQSSDNQMSEKMQSLNAKCHVNRKHLKRGVGQVEEEAHDFYHPVVWKGFFCIVCQKWVKHGRFPMFHIQIREEMYI